MQLGTIVTSFQRHTRYNIYNIQYTIYNIQYTIYNTQYTRYNIQYTIYKIQDIYSIRLQTISSSKAQLLVILNQIEPKVRQKYNIYIQQDVAVPTQELTQNG